MALLALFIVPLLLLVAVPHELAHLLLARRFGVTVHEFGLGLPPRAWSCHWRGVRWSVNWLLPLGAFVKLKGEHGGDAGDDFAALAPVKRAAIVAAGPLANLAIALIAIALSITLVGVPLGLEPHGGGQMTYRAAHNPLDALTALHQQAARTQQPTADGAVLGWLGVGQVMDELQGAGIPPLAWFLALLATLSLGIGATNLLPVPPLDGARIVFSLMEAVTGRRLDHWAARLHVVGIVALVVLFLAVTSADVLRLLAGQHLVR